METNTTASAASDRARAELFLASAFTEIIASQGGDLKQIDGALRSRLPHGVRPHDRRSRTIATKMGDVSFSYRRFRDACGNTVVPFADTLDFPWYARISPAARSLVDNGVVPDAECEASEICVESDGTYFKLQGPDGGSVEVKALVAYAGKLAEGGKVLRARAVRHGCATRAQGVLGGVDGRRGHEVRPVEGRAGAHGQRRRGAVPLRLPALRLR